MKPKRNGFFKICKKYVNDAFSYIWESKDYVYIGMGFFFLSAIAGFYFSSQLGFIDEILRQILDRTSNLTGIDLILFIFSNNASVSFAGLFFGIVLGIFPLINLAANGLVLGYVFAKVYAVSGISDFWRILPHGIFELPAIFISLGLGIRLGMAVFSKPIIRELRYRISGSVKVFFFVILPLLVVAAAIEGLLIILLK